MTWIEEEGLTIIGTEVHFKIYMKIAIKTRRIDLGRSRVIKKIGVAVYSKRLIKIVIIRRRIDAALYFKR